MNVLTIKLNNRMNKSERFSNHHTVQTNILLPKLNQESKQTMITKKDIAKWILVCRVSATVNTNIVQ